MSLRTGEVARQARVNVETLRFYERRGILPEPPRRGSGYREYPEETVDLIRFIKRAQELGFSLSQVEELLSLRGSSRRVSKKVSGLVQAKIAARVDAGCRGSPRRCSLPGAVESVP